MPACTVTTRLKHGILVLIPAKDICIHGKEYTPSSSAKPCVYHCTSWTQIDRVRYVSSHEVSMKGSGVAPSSFFLPNFSQKYPKHRIFRCFKISRYFLVPVGNSHVASSLTKYTYTHIHTHTRTYTQMLIQDHAQGQVALCSVRNKAVSCTKQKPTPPHFRAKVSHFTVPRERALTGTLR